MDGENNGKPYEQMDDLGGKLPIFGNIQVVVSFFFQFSPRNLGKIMIQFDDLRIFFRKMIGFKPPVCT